MRSSLESFMLGLCLLMFSVAPLWALIPSLAMSSTVTGAGTTSALFGSFEMLGAGLIGVLISVVHDGSSRPMVVIIIVMYFCMVATYLIGRLLGVEDGPVEEEIAAPTKNQ